MIYQNNPSITTVSSPMATFGYDINKITVVKRNSLQKKFILRHKSGVANDILKEIASILIAKGTFQEAWNLN